MNAGPLNRSVASAIGRWFSGFVAATTLAAVCGCGGSGGDAPDDALRGKSDAKSAGGDSVQSRVDAEIKKLTGKWTVLSMRADGIPTPAADWFRYSFDGDRMTTETSAAGPRAVKFRLDPSTDPKTLDTSITVHGVEEISEGIYSIDGDVLRLSWRVGGERPADFTSRDGDDKIVLVLQRAAD
jgi:uncharacterized protein (TIGR03067 family)